MQSDYLDCREYRPVIGKSGPLFDQVDHNNFNFKSFLFRRFPSVPHESTMLVRQS
jgi:hypothetical protein